MKRNIHTHETLMERRTRQVRRLYFAAALTMVACMVLSVPAFAADEDPLAIVNNLSDFIFSCIWYRSRHSMSTSVEGIRMGESTRSGWTPQSARNTSAFSADTPS